MCETSTERVSRLAPGELQRVRDDGVEPVWELVPLRAARPALAVAHVVPRVYRDVLLDQRLVQLFEPPQMLVQAVRPEHHRGGVVDATLARSRSAPSPSGSQALVRMRTPPCASLRKLPSCTRGMAGRSGV